MSRKRRQDELNEEMRLLEEAKEKKKMLKKEIKEAQKRAKIEEKEQKRKEKVESELKKYGIDSVKEQKKDFGYESYSDN